MVGSGFDDAQRLVAPLVDAAGSCCTLADRFQRAADGFPEEERGAARRLPPRSGRDRLLAVALGLLPRDRHLVDLVGPVGEAQRAQVRRTSRQREVVATPAAAVDLDRAVDDLQRDLRARRP